MTATAIALCEAGAVVVDAGVDAPDGEAPDGESDASKGADGGPDAAGPLPPSARDNRCLVTLDSALACPSNASSAGMVAGKDGASHLLFSALVRDERTLEDSEYLQIVHLDARSSGKITMDPLPPHAVKSAMQSLGLLPAAADREAWLFLTRGNELRGGVLVPGTPVALGAPFPMPASGYPGFFTSRSGEGFLTLAPVSGSEEGPLGLVRGLPDAPRFVKTTVPSAQLIMRTTDPTGTPAGLFSVKGSNTVRLLEGESFAKERWSHVGEATDLVYVEEPSGAVPAVLLSTGVQVLRSAATDPSAPSAVLGSSFSTCSTGTSVGFTCDDCPVNETCESAADELHATRLLTRGGRLFAVYYATEVRHRMGYSRDTTPIIGVGCVCALHERDTSEVADSLVVVEILSPADPKAQPRVVERMRLPLYAARASGPVTLWPRGDGDVDVLVELPRGPVTDAPKMLRVLRLSTKDIP